MFTQFSKLLNIQSNQFHHVGYPIVIIPFMLNALMRFVQHYRLNVLKINRTVGVFEWLAVVIAFIGILPMELRGKTTSYNFKLISESNVLSIAFAFILGGFLLGVFRNKFEKHDESKRLNIIALFIVPTGFFSYCLDKNIIGLFVFWCFSYYGTST